MPLGTSNITVTTAANWIPEVWMEEIRAFREINVVAAQVVKRLPFEGSVGDTIHIPGLDRLTVNNVTEGADGTNSVSTEGEFNGQVTRWRQCRVQIPDLSNVQSKYNMRSAYTAACAKAIVEDLDAHILALESGFQGGQRYEGDNTTLSGAGADFTDAGVRGLIERLDTVNVPFDDRFLIAHPSQKNILLGIARFVEYQSIGPGNMPIRNGLLGEIYGIPVYFTTNVASIGVNKANVLGQRDAIVLAMQQDVRVQMDYILQNLSWLVSVDYIGQAFEFRDDHAISVHTVE